ncbi:MAG: hypothetical protein KBG83_00015 [Bacteroidetes bacterium]|nr:hypothetical protein [Bacteroidota bacterium]
MDTNTAIKIKTQELIHGRGMTVYELADKVNRSYSYLCRIASPTEELPTPLEIILPAMKLKRNYDLLKFMSWECGFALVKLPKPAMSKKDENDLVADYQRAVTEAISALLNFLENPIEESYRIVEQKIVEATEQGIAAKKYCEKKSKQQLDMGI